MAEIRIPRDRIPEDILLRLQAIGQSVMFPLTGGPGMDQSVDSKANTCLTSSSSSVFSAAPSPATATSIPVATTASPAQIRINSRSFTSPERLPMHLTMSSAASGPNPSTSVMPRHSPSLRNSPSLTQPSSPSPRHRLSPAPGSTSPGGRSPRHVTSHGDETDGGEAGSVVHVLSEDQQPKRHSQSSNADIVRVFPLDDGKRDEVDAPRHYPDDDSGIVRIFPDHDEDRRTKSPRNTNSCSQIDNGNTDVKAEQQQQAQMNDNIMLQSQQFPSPASLFNNIRNTLVYNSKLNPATQIPSTGHLSQSPPSPPQPSPSRNHKSPHTPARRHAKSGHFRRSSVSATSSRKTPEIPTPPQTPEDAEDDEVFNYDVMSSYRLSQESTPQRHNSDSRRLDARCSLGFSSPFSPAQKLSEMNVGDRQHTRKRLSFEDEDMATPLSSSQQVQYHSDPALSSITSVNHHHHQQQQYFQAMTPSFFGRLNSQQHPSNQRQFIAPLSPSLCKPSSNHRTSTPSPFISQVPTCSSHTDSVSHTGSSMCQSQTLAPPPSPFRPSNAQSAFPEVRDILEQLSGGGPRQQRQRLHSDSDRDADGLPKEVFYGRGSPVLAPPRSRGQTFSHGKRRRLGEFRVVYILRI